MGILRPRFVRALLVLPLLAACALLGASRAGAQVNPFWDHYKVYEVAPKPSSGVQVFLLDQFTQTPHTVQFMNRFANPVQKEHAGQTFPINSPFLHYSWWKIDELPFDAYVIAENQFGNNQSLHILYSTYLLAPATKNQPGTPPPQANHYKCYACEGDPINVPVFLSDQFYGRPAMVLFPRYFCNPAQKNVIGGPTFPIFDPNQHYVVYELDPGNGIFPATINDQFVHDATVQLSQDHLLMVPTNKLGVVNVTGPTWGRLKTLYR